MDKRKKIIDSILAETKSPTFTAVMVRLISLYPENQVKGYDGGKWFILREKDVRKDTPVSATTYYKALEILRKHGYIETRRNGLQLFCRIAFEKFLEETRHAV